VFIRNPRTYANNSLSTTESDRQQFQTDSTPRGLPGISDPTLAIY
jgi:hypothetical protein